MQEQGQFPLRYLLQAGCARLTQLWEVAQISAGVRTRSGTVSGELSVLGRWSWQLKERSSVLCFFTVRIQASIERQAQGGAYCRCGAVCRHDDI